MAAAADLIVRIITDVSKAKGLDETADKSSKMSKTLATASKVSAGALLAVGAAAFKAGGAAAEDAQSQALLAKSMENSASASKSQIAATEDWISKMSMATGVADDELRPALGALVRSTGSVEESQKALALAMDISAATGKPLQSVSEALAKGYAGNTTSLGKLVPGISKATMASKDMTKIMDELGQKTEGSAAAAAETAAGQMDIMTVAMGEAEEQMGSALLPVMTKFAKVMATVAQWIQKNSTLFQIIVGVIAAVAAAILVLNAAVSVYTAVTMIAGIVSGAAWLAALWPILLVAAAVAAVIAVVVILWKKSQTFRKIVTGVWNAIKTAALAVARVIKAAWSVLFTVLSAYVKAYAAIFRAIFTVIRSVATVVGHAVRSVWTSVWSAITSAARTMSSGVQAVFHAIRDAVGFVMDKIRDLAALVRDFRVPDAMIAPFHLMEDAINAVIGAVRSLIEWLGKIKIPKISLPKLPGLGRSVAAPGVTTATYGAPRISTTSSRSGTVGTSGNTYIINGALDPEAVARQIKRIESRHERRIGLRIVTT